MPRHLDPGKPCACTSGLSFQACCRPYLRGEREPETAGKLMRSRFSAFALENAPYLWRTLHATHPDRARPEAEVLRSFRRAARSFDYRGLTVLEEETAGDRARVLFIAHLEEHGKDLSFLELSDFVHDGAGWRYAAGVTKDPKEFPDPGKVTLASFG